MIQCCMGFFWIPAMMIFEIIKRVAFMIIYPIAYILRKWAREQRFSNNLDTAFVLWSALDDSIWLEGKADYGVDVEYCYYGKKSAIVEKMPEGWLKEFARSYHWGAVRNNGINLSRWMSVGEMVAKVSHLGGEKNFYEYRAFSKNKLRHRPYLQFFIGQRRFQAGWISCGRWEVELFVKSGA